MEEESNAATRATQPAVAIPAAAVHQGQNEGDASGSGKGSKNRHRASVACAACRERRIRCVVPPGDSECVQCKRAGSECIIKNDDERRRPISRAYMSALTDRVSMLEGMLKDRGTEPPPVVYPAKTTRGSQHADSENSPTRLAPWQPKQHPRVSQEQSIPENTSPESITEEAIEASNIDSPASPDGQRDTAEAEILHGTPIDDKNQGLVSRLLSTRGHLSFDQISGRLRYFGPTVNSHIYSELDVDDEKSSREAIEQARRAQKIIRTLPIETHDYLLGLFWEYYNSVLHGVTSND
jgi:hypothetical protein